MVRRQEDSPMHRGLDGQMDGWRAEWMNEVERQVSSG